MDAQYLIRILNSKEKVTEEVLHLLPEFIKINQTILNWIFGLLIFIYTFPLLIWILQMYTYLSFDLGIFLAALYMAIYFISVIVVHKYVKKRNRIYLKMISKGWIAFNPFKQWLNSTKTLILFTILGGVTGLNFIIYEPSYLENYIIATAIFVFFSFIPRVVGHFTAKYTLSKIYRGNLEDFSDFVNKLQGITKKGAIVKNLNYFKINNWGRLILKCCTPIVPNEYVLISIYDVNDEKVINAIEIAKKLDKFSENRGILSRNAMNTLLSA